MLARSDYFAVALLIATVAAPLQVSSADDSDCVLPALPTLPAGLVDDVDTDRVSAVVEAAMTTSFEYLACLDRVIETRKESLTDEERRKLEGAMTTRLTELRAMANQWNSMYTSYTNNKVRKQ